MNNKPNGRSQSKPSWTIGAKRTAGIGLVCALVIAIFAWNAYWDFTQLDIPRAEDCYYNLLVQGFRAGQLNVKREPPPALARLPDPYNPTAIRPYLHSKQSGIIYDMSYYKGKLYLYFGPSPALVLFWPYVTLTGHYISQKGAVVIFLAIGFVTSAVLLWALWRRYFPEARIWVLSVGILILALVPGLPQVLSTCGINVVARTCAFAFTMLALAAIWCALHEPKRRVIWLSSASLAYGLAIGSVPSLLFGAIILLMPVAQAWRSATEPVSRRGVALLLAAAAGPLMLIGIGLMLYNTLRFGSPSEFGWHYQIGGFRQIATHPFSLRYLWFNFFFYFLDPTHWTSHIPLLRAFHSLPLPSGYQMSGGSYGGILIIYPLAWLALAAPLAWRGRPAEEVSGLRWFVAAIVSLFVINALTVCLFCSAYSRYELDFLPALMMLAAIGVFGLERSLADYPAWGRVTRWICCSLVAYSVGFHVFLIGA
ncbi:MAG TPA: hypothetical protein VMF08_08885 [Candidatus Sulfotelmatobacter sp.]|nr:hypothetical protein [Candidatus Sulfotelmatobacter sp.]